MLGLRASSWRCCDVRPASDEQQHGASRGNRPAVRRFVRRGRKIQRNRTVPMTATAERMVAMRCFIVRARTATRAACARSTGAADSGGSTRPTVTEERASMRTNERAPQNRSAETPRPSGPGRLPRVWLAEHGRQRLLGIVAADDDVERVGQTHHAREVAVPRIGVKES
jgi:hypothetical protein